MNRLKRIFVLMMLTLASAVVHAQTENDNADVMRSNGKIYVVVAVVLTILIGLLIYVISIDRKISRLEKK